MTLNSAKPLKVCSTLSLATINASLSYSTKTYLNEGLTAKAKFAGIVQGVVVQATKYTFDEPKRDEDSSISNPEERKKLFGQEDHVRYYGRTDFKQRLRDSGFAVEEIAYANKIGEGNSELYQLNGNEIIFRCIK